MGKHETGYRRAERDLHPTPPWVVDVLARHLNFRGARVWEPACGPGRMVNALRAHGALVYASDVVDYGGTQDEVLDFLSDREPRFADFDFVVSNPPGGKGNWTAFKFIKRGLERVTKAGATLALLLPADFDSGATRRPFFVDRLSATVVLTRRPVWFDRTDGEKAAPKENFRWFVWRPNQGPWPAIHLYDEDPR
jgi:hypothetical protein